MTGQRAAWIVDVLLAEFGEMIKADPGSFRRKFRKMAASPFAFYRGAACLFYADLQNSPHAGFLAEFLDERTSRVWMHGDLHAENYGTYMNAVGQLTFNVNDFDEAYVGPFTWDLQRFAASIALIGYAKALSDEAISELVGASAEAYVTEVRAIHAGGDDSIGSLTLDTTDGPLREVLQRSRLNTRIDMLAEQTGLDNYERRFTLREGVHRIDDATRERVEAAFRDYLGTVPPGRKERPEAYQIKDIVLRRGVGIGSAGLPSYNLLLEGHTQALENDVVLYMKKGQTPAVSRHITDDRIQTYFRHQGHRTVESQRALQASADAWLGFTSLDGAGQVVAEVSPYAVDLDWSDLNEPDELRQVVAQLGRTIARMHSVADDESAHDLVDFSTEEAITGSLDHDEPGFVKGLVDFAHHYGRQAREDHQTFVDLFRNGKLPGVR